MRQFLFHKSVIKSASKGDKINPVIISNYRIYVNVGFIYLYFLFKLINVLNNLSASPQVL